MKTREMLKCGSCNKQFSPRRGTPYYKSKLSVWKLDRALLHFTLSSTGLSAVRLSHLINVQPKTAYLFLQKVRNQLIPEFSLERFVADVKRRARTPLCHEIEFDGAQFGGTIRPKNQKKKSTDQRRIKYRNKHKQIAVGVMERGGRILITLQKTEGSAVELIKRSAKKHTIAYCDMAPAWGDLGLRFELRQVNHEIAYAEADANSNTVESLWSLARENENGVYRHISGVHLLGYLAEVAWRRQNNKVGNASKVRSNAQQYAQACQALAQV